MTLISDRAKSLGQVIMRANNRRRFLSKLPTGAEVFDIGCGNDSPYLFKSIRPDIRYIGLDVADYHVDHDPKEYADQYLVVPPSEFLSAIEQREGEFDAVVSSHNLEHCSEPDGVVTAMARALRPDGRIYLAFPAADTVNFPSRDGTLNFYDDDTHVQPPDYRRVIGLLTAAGITINFAAERFRPPNWVLVGLINEPLSRIRKKVLRGTWALYGFETVIWGTKS
ncbi:class I SAM-dependent methyltransferase [Mycolicibacterium sp. HS_4_1]